VLDHGEPGGKCDLRGGDGGDAELQRGGGAADDYVYPAVDADGGNAFDVDGECEFRVGGKLHVDDEFGVHGDGERGEFPERGDMLDYGEPGG
jgi:hypothetical protein